MSQLRGHLKIPFKESHLVGLCYLVCLLLFFFFFWKSRGQYASIPGICKKTLPSPFHPLLTPRDLRSSPPALLPSLPGPPHFHLHQFTLYTLLLPPLLPSHHTSTIAPSTPLPLLLPSHHYSTTSITLLHP